MRRVQKFAATILILLTVFSSAVSACPMCRAQVERVIYEQSFFGNLFTMLSPIVIITAIGFGLYYADEISDRLKGLK
jgi:phosphatidylglycerophosphate synthase